MMARAAAALLALLAAAAEGAHQQSQPPLWPTAFGPPTSTGEGRVTGPDTTQVLQASWLFVSSNYTPVLGPYFDASGNVLMVAMTNSSSAGIGYAAVAASPQGPLIWATPLVTNNTYGCAPLAAALDSCGWLYSSIGCGPEPLSLNNYLFKVNASDGSLSYSSSVFGTGALTVLLPSALDGCATVYTTLGARDAPSSVAILNASTGAIVDAAGATNQLLPGWASLALLSPASPAPATASASSASSAQAEAQEQLVVGGNAAWPYVASFNATSGSSSRSDGDSSAPVLSPVWSTLGPNGQSGAASSPVPWLPPVLLPDGSVVAGADPQGAGTANILYRTAVNGSLLWTLNLTSPGDAAEARAREAAAGAAAGTGTGTGTGYVSGLAYSSTIDVLFVTVEFPHSQFANLWYVNASDGALLGPGCPLSGFCCDPALVRGVAVDARSDGSVWVWFTVIEWWPSSSARRSSNATSGGGAGGPSGSSDMAAGGPGSIPGSIPGSLPGTTGSDSLSGPAGTMFASFIEGARFTTGSCTATSAVLTTSSTPMPGDGPLAVPFLMPWIPPAASGLLPYRFPTVAVGPQAGMVSVLVPGAGIIKVVPWDWQEAGGQEAAGPG